MNIHALRTSERALYALELARRCVHSLNIRNLLTWNQPNILRADNGDMLFGSHYVQNMMLWAVPAALLGQVRLLVSNTS